ncbi:MAG: flavodoxin [Coprobacillaceae bacterium]
MRKGFKIVLCMFCLFLITACSNNENNEETTNNDSSQGEKKENDEENNNTNIPFPGGEGNILIVYFSFPETDGNDTSAGASRVNEGGSVVGNTELFAKQIQERTDGDLLRIETVQEYPGSHEPLVDQASDEKDNNLRPELSSKITNLDQYDTIFIGYPNWWGDMPMPLYTFLEEYSFSGKTIIPFSTHGGSGFSSTINTISDMQSGANVNSNGLTISRNDITDSKEEIDNWLSELGY